jgi:hypothetical protein
MPVKAGIKIARASKKIDRRHSREISQPKSLRLFYPTSLFRKNMITSYSFNFQEKEN